MTPGNWQRLKRLFEEAILLPPAERALFAERVRREDETLGAALDSLLKGYQQPTWSLDRTFPIGSCFEQQSVFSVGTIVLGRFKILRLLGKGGMGEVYHALDIELRQPVALKTIRPEIASDPNTIERFRKEVLLARQVLSPYVCRIYELYVLPSEDGLTTSAFFTMEFLEGKTLADQIQNEGPLPWKQAEAIALELCDGLKAIHESGVVHRDLKTRNVMLATRNGRTQAVVMDFGLARRSALTAAAFGGTASQEGNTAIVGTPECMAPEQFEGGPVSSATDVYALGLVLYEMVTGVRPFAASSPLGTAVRRGKRPASPSLTNRDLPRRWDTVIDRCLQYEPADRFSSAAEVAQALVTRPLSLASAKNFLKTARAHPIKSGALLVLIAALAIGGWLWTAQHRYHPPGGDAERWYQEGVAAVREGTYLKAVNALKQALANNSRFALAHARLADAYNELDYYGDAKDELLKASSSAADQNLPRLYQRYLRAIQATVLHEFSTALEEYTGILGELPQSAKADGYLDLGRAYENVGDLQHAVSNYAAAAKAAPQYPAAFVRLGVLEGRQNHTLAAEGAFDAAEKLYTASSNYEGTAEIAYQRGSMYTSNADYPRARGLLTQAFHLAENLQNTQLEVRALSRLSALEQLALNYADATKWARDAIAKSEASGLGYWATEGQTRLASALIYQKGKLDDASDSAQRALNSAERNGWPLLAANAQLVLCNIRNRQDRPNDAIPLAQSALTYYTGAGYFTESTSSLVLLIRAKRDRAEFADALRLGQQGLDVEKKSGSPPVMIQMEEVVGRVDIELEKFQDALGHFEMAAKLARQNQNRLLNYEVMLVADALSSLGRYEEAEQKLDSLASDAKTDTYLAWNIALVLAGMRLSQGRYREAIQVNQRVRELDPFGSPSPEVDISDALAELSLGSTQQAARLASRALLNAQRMSDKVVVAEAEAANARVELQTASPREAKTSAESAQVVFDETGKWESAWMNLALLSQISSALGNSQATKTYALKALDILSGFEHNCEATAYKLYIGRPDVKTVVRHLTAVTGKN